MAMPIEINAARKNLQETLGEDMKIYLQNLKSWFKQKITKEEFDVEARALLPENSVNLHNDFLLAIISRCQTLSSSLIPKENSISGKSVELSKHGKLAGVVAKHVKSKFSKYRRRSVHSRGVQKFTNVNPMLKAEETKLKGAETVTLASREFVLPDISMVHGRMLVCAWETGLEEVSDAAVQTVMQAVENQLKNIISVVLSQRNAYKLREKKMKFAFGTPNRNPYRRQSHIINDNRTESDETSITNSGIHVPCHKPTTELGEELGVYELALSDTPVIQPPVSMFDLLHALQTHRSLFSSHSVYETAVQKAIHQICHQANNIEDNDNNKKEMFDVKMDSFIL